MALCECGCGEETEDRRWFLPGHDQRLRTLLERRVGGVLALRELVVAAETYALGESTAEALTQKVRRVFSTAWRSEFRQGRLPLGTEAEHSTVHTDTNTET